MLELVVWEIIDLFLYLQRLVFSNLLFQFFDVLLVGPIRIHVMVKIGVLLLLMSNLWSRFLDCLLRNILLLFHNNIFSRVTFILLLLFIFLFDFCLFRIRRHGLIFLSLNLDRVVLEVWDRHDYGRWIQKQWIRRLLLELRLHLLVK